MKELKKGFYTALGTPLTADAKLDAASLAKEIEMQIAADASGLLLMGSMGMEASIPDDAYVEAVKVAAETNKGRLPLFVGAMDNSAARVLDRINRIKDYDFDAVVLTTPFYFASGEAILCKFFEMIADKSAKPVFLYDLPTVTKCKITFSMVERLSKHPNIKGIKSGDIVLARLIKLNIPEFQVLYSNLDCFDTAIAYGIDKVLDGMFSATPVNGKKFAASVKDGDMDACTKSLNNIIYLRDVYIKNGVMQAFTASMNLLGMNGNFAPDYFGAVNDAQKADVEAAMKKIGEL